MKYTLKDLYNDVKVNGRDCTDDHAITIPRNVLKPDPLVRLMTLFLHKKVTNLHAFVIGQMF